MNEEPRQPAEGDEAAGASPEWGPPGGPSEPGQASAPPPPETGAEVAAGVSTQKRSDAERRALLAQQLQQGAARGLRVESQAEYQAVFVEGQKVNHVLHVIITICTCGLWGIGWLVVALTGGEKRHQLIVDEFGNVHWQNLG